MNTPSGEDDDSRFNARGKSLDDGQAPVIPAFQAAADASR
jgi:hypothetical protein